MAKPTFYEFFAGGGMARAGLGDGWKCLFANDFDPKKAASYRANWGTSEFVLGDVAALHPSSLPGRADLAWASFPCQDLSLAGLGAGLDGKRSGAFWPFWRLMQGLAAEGRAPRTIVLENVFGALTSHGGADFRAICQALADGGYEFGPLVIDAAHFVPQSRPRLFIVATRDHAFPPRLERTDGGELAWTPETLLHACEGLPPVLRRNLVWWRLPRPEPTTGLADILEPDEAVEWNDPIKTISLLNLMNDNNIRKVVARKNDLGQRYVGAAFRRTRIEGDQKVQRWECRFDGVAGCLRTPAGGSSRQTLIVVQGDGVWTRLLSPRETARLMGLPDSYELPASRTDAYHLTGDGVVVPVVRHIARHIVEPVLEFAREVAA